MQWLIKYPYALPMLANAFLLTTCAVCVGMGLDETLQACKGKPGLGAFALKLFARGLKAVVPSSSPLYTRIPFSDYDEEGPLLSRPTDPTESYELEEKATNSRRNARVLPFRRIWTKNVLCTLLAQAFFDFQMGYVLHFFRLVCACIMTSFTVPSTISGCFSSRPRDMTPATPPVLPRNSLSSSPVGWACCRRVLDSRPLSLV